MRKLLAVRREAGEITARQYLSELKQFESQLSRVRDNRLSQVGGGTTAALQGVDAQAGQANQAIQQFGFLVNDAQQAQYGFRQAIVATSNNLPIFLTQLQQISTSSKAAGTTLTSTLVKSFTGIGGVIAVLNLAATAFVLFGSRGEDALDGVEGSAKNARDTIREVLGAIIEFNDNPIRFDVDTKNVDALLTGAKRNVFEIQEALRPTQGLTTGSARGESKLAFGDNATELLAEFRTAQDEGRLLTLTDEQKSSLQSAAREPEGVCRHAEGAEGCD